jgi:excisionase family DNA binding protein
VKPEDQPDDDLPALVEQAEQRVAADEASLAVVEAKMRVTDLLMLRLRRAAHAHGIAAPEKSPRKKSALAPHAASGEKLLTLAEASALIRTPSETIRSWIWQGRLEAYRPGRNLLVREAELLEFVTNNETRKKRARKARGA